MTETADDTVVFVKARPGRDRRRDVAAAGPDSVPDLAPESFADSFAPLYARAYRVAYRLLGSEPAAQDVAQETMARAYARWSRVSDHSVAWCVTVASRLAVDGLRTRSRRRLVDTDEIAEPGSAVAALVERIDLYASLRRLPRKQRQVVVLRYIGDLSEAQTAEVLGVSLGTVKSHASRGVAALRAEMGTHASDSERWT